MFTSFQSMIVLGIDPGSINTGYAFIDVQGLNVHVLEYGTLHAPENRSFEDRLLHIITSLEKLIDQYKPNVLSMESAFVAINAKSALVLGHVRGAILVACKKKSMSFVEFPPTSVKQVVTGKGNASKEMVANMIYAQLGISPSNVTFDATDALAIAWAYVNMNPLTSMLHIKSRHKKKRATTNEWKTLIEKMGGTI